MPTASFLDGSPLYHVGHAMPWHECPSLSQEAGRLSPEGKKIPSRGIGAMRVKQAEALWSGGEGKTACSILSLLPFTPIHS